MKKKRDQPHDRFFRDLMQDINFAKEFLINHLDKYIRAQIDWNTLALYDPAVTGQYNKQLYADLIFTAKTKDHQAEVIIILNHERQLTPLYPIRVLEYKLGALKKSLQQKQSFPAFIVHLTWCNGRQQVAVHKGILDYFSNKELASKLFLEPSQIVYAEDVPDEAIASHKLTGILELFMRYADDPTFLQWLEAHGAIARQLENHQYIDRSLDYLTDIGHYTPEELLTSLSKVSKKLEERMLTTRQQIERIGEKRGKKRGIQQGIQQEKLAIAKNMLARGLDVRLTAQVTGLSEAAIKQFQE